MHGGITSRIEDFRKKVVKPLIERVQAAGYTLDHVAEVMHTAHAKDRSDQIAKINAQMPDGGSGLNRADARTILAATLPALRAPASQFQAITSRARTIQLNSGIVNQDQVNAGDAAYKNYMPLKEGWRRGGRSQARQHRNLQSSGNALR